MTLAQFIEDPNVAWALAAGLLFGLVSGLLLARRHFADKLAAAALQRQQAIDALSSSRDDAAHRERVIFEQHRALNDLQASKLRGELQLIEQQLAARETREDREHAGREFHELMVEKARLEIDNLRLHNAELRRRIEDWDSGHSG